MFATDAFQLVSNRLGPKKWNAELGELFQFGRRIAESLNADIQAGRLPRRSCVRSVLKSLPDSSVESSNDLRPFINEYPISLTSPFEGVASISGGIWFGSELFGKSHEDAVLKLQFDAGTQELPLHSHEYSDRVIVVLEGSGEFFVSQDITCESTATAKPMSVGAGDVIAFNRGVVHTFRTSETALVLLSYHSPFIALNDPRQYTVASKHL